MDAARQPMQRSALMYGSTLVSARQFNHSYNDSNTHPQSSCFTTRQIYPAPRPHDPSRQNHGFISDDGRLDPQLKHDGHRYDQSVRSSAQKQMSENNYSHLAGSDVSLEDSLLCSPWPPLPTLERSPSFTIPLLPEISGPPHWTQAQTIQVPEHDLTFPPLEQSLPSSNSSLLNLTPGLTPNSSIESTPATSVGGFGDDGLARPSHKASLQSLEGFRHIQPKPPELPPVTLSDKDYGRTTSWAPEGASHLASSFDLPGWAPNAPADLGAHEIMEEPQFLDPDFGMPTLDSRGYDTIDPNALDAFNDYIDSNAFDFLKNDTPAAYPDLFNDFNYLATPSHNDPVFPVAHSTSDPFMPSMVMDNDTRAIPDFDTRPYTGVLGADSMRSVSEPMPLATPTAGRTLNGEGSRRNTDRDNELVMLRVQGLSYRDIKTYHGFDVAESTLRGRMRSLMKTKEERVRKPTWKGDNVRLLCHCVMEFAIQQQLPTDIISDEGLPVLKSEQALSKVSWKKVAKAMADRGSYHYGNATVKKKYMDVRKQQLTKML